MNRTCALATLILVVFFLNLLGFALALAHETIKFGLYPYESARTLYNLFMPAARRIEAKTGKQVVLVSAPDQTSFIGKARQGAYDLALVSPNCFFMIQEAGYRVIARGEPTFQGGAIVRSDSPITSPVQLRGKRIAAIGKYSYGGYLYFRQELAGLGISPDRDVEFGLLDKADSIIISVLNHQYDAGVIRLDVLEQPAFASVRDQVRIISRSPEIPQFPFVVKNTLDPATVDQIRGVLTAIGPGNPEDQGILKSLQINRIVGSRNDDYDAFRLIIEKAEK